MSTIDVVLLIPLIPAAPVLITPFLPWERWIPWGKIPKGVLGPYLVYGAFVAWHFGLGWWFVLAVAAVGMVLSVIAALSATKK
jgi:hypothetical protein